FSFVEAVGMGYLGKIARWIRPSAKPRASDDRLGLPPAVADRCRPVIAGLDLGQQVDLAWDVLHTLGLDDRLAPLVVFCGHAGQCTNNAHASTLDCGACHGQPGELAPGVAEVLARRYPGDTATGYTAGDLRGAISVRVPLGD
ncbi:MAG: DUF2309 domain-containing protein, partial [Thermoanaerobaculia bacterium]|nr:DUF2309 domain-containing protein [Thermoanaerobaculia bacterium]